ncbi:MAG: nitrous oxide reductase family maturation protein NosD [Campylobacter sp.]|nr:nitrous oxide reductase family maturation protein NosD [Campylobacter sp.]
MRVIALLILTMNFALANPLQEAIDSAKSGDVIELGKGEFIGDIIINKPLTIKGNDTIITGENKGTVISIVSPNVTLENLTIRGSGNSHGVLDAGVSCKSAYNVKILNCDIKDSLFGINFEQCNDSIIHGNRITSKDTSPGLKGDGIRLWYSHNNELTYNYVYDSRDTVIWYCSGNLIQHNVGVRGRYALHFMYSGRNLVLDNNYTENSVGVFFMFSNGSEAKRNIVASSTGAFGLGFGMKDVSDFLIEDNIMIYNARGLYIDNSPYEPGTTNIYRNNQILYNTVAVQTQSVQLPSIFENNNFIGNMDMMVSGSNDEQLTKNTWIGNYFDEYQGFDRDNDGFGDTPYQNYIYADILWQTFPNLQFFYGSAVISGINLLAKLAPFSEPMLLITDESPRMKPLEFKNE